MTLDIRVNWQVSKHETRWPVSHDHIAGTDGGVAQDGAQTTYIFAIWCGRSISLSIDSCQNKVSADQYHMTVSRTQV